ncbi:MAG TPA: endonuclease/exonuclease/phosphatase family protein [Patescibacteria group bacterium]
MKIKILQLNIWAGSRFPALKKFLKENDFDILCFQEVSGPRDSGNVHVEFDSFDALEKILGKTHNSRLVKSNIFAADPNNQYEANAIFYKNALQLISEDILWLNKRDTPFPQNGPLEELGRSALLLTLSKNSKEFLVINAHLAWAQTSIEQPHQRAQNLKLVEKIKDLNKPWILTGDFNISPENQTILDLEKLGKNLTKEVGVYNTIDPTVHTAWEKIKPGFPVDYIFVSPDIKVNRFEILENIHMSDHFGLTVTIEL